MDRIVAAVDGSAPSLRAAGVAADLASRYDAELILVTVAPQLSAVMSHELAAYLREEHIDAPLSELGSAHAETVLAGARLEAQSKGAGRISMRPLAGDAAEEIITLAHDQKADLIVIGTRGHGRLAGLLLGSVAQKVLGRWNSNLRNPLLRRCLDDRFHLFPLSSCAQRRPRCGTGSRPRSRVHLAPSKRHAPNRATRSR